MQSLGIGALAVAGGSLLSKMGLLARIGDCRLQAPPTHRFQLRQSCFLSALSAALSSLSGLISTRIWRREVHRLGREYH